MADKNLRGPGDRGRTRTGAVNAKTVDRGNGAELALTQRMLRDGLGRPVATGVAQVIAPLVVEGEAWRSPTLNVLDARDRPVLTRSPLDSGGDALTQYAYAAENGRTRVHVTDANGECSESLQDGQGKTVQVREFGDGCDGAAATYQHDPLGQLVQITDARNNVTTLAYDALGRQVRLESPDTGITQWRYNSLGQLEEQEDARGTAGLVRNLYEQNSPRVQTIQRGDGLPFTFTYGLKDGDKAADARAAHALGRLWKTTF